MAITSRCLSSQKRYYRILKKRKERLHNKIEEGIKETNSMLGDCTYYIPSYEYVTLAGFYGKDYRHVSNDAVSNIMSCFINSYDKA